MKSNAWNVKSSIENNSKKKTQIFIAISIRCGCDKAARRVLWQVRSSNWKTFFKFFCTVLQYVQEPNAIHPSIHPSGLHPFVAMAIRHYLCIVKNKRRERNKRNKICKRDEKLSTECHRTLGRRPFSSLLERE